MGVFQQPAGSTWEGFMDDYVKVIVLDNDFEAQLLDSILEERDIPHLMVSYHDTAYDGLFQTQKGWGHVSAPAPFKQEILEILDEVRNQAQQPVFP
jgi:shikimate 5-dehydrogenase